ncbi:energy-coupling factor transporter transmembrane component T [Paenibacillus larvae]|uniref:energy-coupling factor transporter transmembrane component T n=1 Tax=Paenibacillus larvae TaxID=1464 RepID=UPI0028BEA979|nr:energy-coupling factor transporter transmembrane component T [Paenibacillus larvae]
MACTTVWRMGMLVSFTAILTFTTTPNKLAQGLEDVMKPLGWVGLSPEKLTLMISLALRFIPTIFEKTEKILKAQASRGADIKELPWVEKGKMLVSLLVPVTVSSFRRAEDLIHSMESRGYVLGAPKTRYHRLNWSRNDSLFLASFLLLVFLVISGEFGCSPVLFHDKIHSIAPPMRYKRVIFHTSTSSGLVTLEISYKRRRMTSWQDILTEKKLNCLLRQAHLRFLKRLYGQTAMPSILAVPV